MLILLHKLRLSRCRNRYGNWAVYRYIYTYAKIRYRSFQKYDVEIDPIATTTTTTTTTKETVGSVDRGEDSRKVEQM